MLSQDPPPPGRLPPASHTLTSLQCVREILWASEKFTLVTCSSFLPATPETSGLSPVPMSQVVSPAFCCLFTFLLATQTSAAHVCDAVGKKRICQFWSMRLCHSVFLVHAGCFKPNWKGAEPGGSCSLQMKALEQGRDSVRASSQKSTAVLERSANSTFGQLH